jgi:hypothetical protein
MVLRRAIPVSRRRLGSSWWQLNEEGCGGNEGRDGGGVAGSGVSGQHGRIGRRER